jgi:hypothetical protein
MSNDRLHVIVGTPMSRITGSVPPSGYLVQTKWRNVMAAERERVAGFGRLEDGLRQAGDWYRWGPYVSERQWGTVREDYSADGEAWNYLPHDHARSRAYRWARTVWPGSATWSSGCALAWRCGTDAIRS